MKTFPPVPALGNMGHFLLRDVSRNLAMMTHRWNRYSMLALPLMVALLALWLGARSAPANSWFRKNGSKEPPRPWSGSRLRVSVMAQHDAKLLAEGAGSELCGYRCGWQHYLDRSRVRHRSGVALARARRVGGRYDPADSGFLEGFLKTND